MAYVVYGYTVYTNASRRDAVARQADRSFVAAGFTASTLVPGIPPGTNTFTYTHPVDAEAGEMTPGQSYPGVQICWQTTDYALAQQAEEAVASELAKGGVVGGSFGSFNAGSG